MKIYVLGLFEGTKEEQAKKLATTIKQNPNLDLNPISCDDFQKVLDSKEFKEEFVAMMYGAKFTKHFETSIESWKKNTAFERRNALVVASDDVCSQFPKIINGKVLANCAYFAKGKNYLSDFRGNIQERVELFQNSKHGLKSIISLFAAEFCFDKGFFLNSRKMEEQKVVVAAIEEAAVPVIEEVPEVVVEVPKKSKKKEHDTDL